MSTTNGGASVVYPTVEKLDPAARKVCEAAVAMVEHSYAPYSKFRYDDSCHLLLLREKISLKRPSNPTAVELLKRDKKISGN